MSEEWYSVQELRVFLRREGFDASDALASWVTKHLNLAYNKGLSHRRAPSPAAKALVEAVGELLNTLPDTSGREAECWDWCWNELDEEAQAAVKAVRMGAVIALAAFRKEMEGA